MKKILHIAAATLIGIFFLSGFLNFDWFFAIPGTPDTESASNPALEILKPYRLAFDLFMQTLKQVEPAAPAKEEVKTAEATDVRAPAVAGSWYPTDPEELQKEVKGYLDATTVQATTKPRIIIVPHPGLEFGGPTMAYTYKAVAPFNYRNIYLIGVTHKAEFDGIAIDDTPYYETPLGKVKVNTDITSFLLMQSSRFKSLPLAHKEEHSLEIQLPFIQTLFPDAQIIPILLSAENNGDPEILAEGIYQAITPDDLVVISTDLSHYPAYENAKTADQKTLNDILTLNPAWFQTQMAEGEKNFPANTITLACGQRAVLAGLDLAKKLNLADAKLLHYENSGDRPAGDKTKVVGYGAVAVYADPDEEFADTVQLSEKDRKLALEIARKAIESEFTGEDVAISMPQNSKLQENFGAFVTLTKNGQLRGCIGNFEPDKRLYEVINDIALDAALRDTRFSPVTADEMKDIKIEISVLSPRKTISSPNEIVPGKHGVYLTEDDKSGTFLPQVATDQNWTREEMLNNLCTQKAGLDENAWQDPAAKLYTYTALVFGEE